MKIPDYWDRASANEMCFNCAKASDGLACTWPSKDHIVPDGAIAVPTLGAVKTMRIFRCPDFVSEYSRCYINYGKKKLEVIV